MEINRFNMVLVRHGGEIGVKSKKTRTRMIKRLNEIIKYKTASMGVEHVSHKYTRTLISGEGMDPIKVAEYIASSIAGVDSTSPVHFFKLTTQEAILEQGFSYALNFLKTNVSFGFKVRRTGNHSFSSLDISRLLAEKVIEESPKEIASTLKINLTNPDFHFFVEIKYDYCFIYHIKFSGINGLPTGTQGVLLAELRPWPNDFLAASLMFRRGTAIIPIFFNTNLQIDIFDIKKFFLDLINVEGNTDFFNIELEKIFIEKWSQTLSKNRLCQACHIFTEKIAESIMLETINYLGSINGTSFNDISLGFLKCLEEKPKITRYRPLLLENTDNIPLSYKFINKNYKNYNKCCRIQDKRYFNDNCTLEPKIVDQIKLEGKIFARELLNEKVQKENKSIFKIEN
ncbi:MAG: THUMP domain-containing protein [Candidatus Thorarchaeota archaeon]